MMNVERGSIFINLEKNVMTNSEKFNRVNSRVQTRPGIIHPIRIGLAAQVLPMIISDCVSESQFLAQNAPSALNITLVKGC